MRENVFPPPAFIVGCPRSGTTLLRFMLDAHPELAIPPETGFFALVPQLCAVSSDELPQAFVEAITNFPLDAPSWQDFEIDRTNLLRALQASSKLSLSDAFRTFYLLYAARFGKKRWGDKTPSHVFCLPAIAELFPEARIIHIVRDGRDVARSLREMWFSPGNNIETLAHHWRAHVLSARRHRSTVRHFLEVQYESLLRDPQSELARICDFLQLPYDAEMLQYHRKVSLRLEEHKARYRKDQSLLISREARLAQQHFAQHPPDISRIDRWREELNETEQQAFAAIAGDVLIDYGYQL